ncbi:MAG: EcoRI family type II restriction endonuclease [Candidatus Woesearchaeota archaeon]|nr:EcoRI family type II restriction endonuclease [Candidatus Woesearchaeota archaeon]
MATSKQLRENSKQHTPKNLQSKQDDKNVALAMDKVVAYLYERLGLTDKGYELDYVKTIKLSELIAIIKSYEKRFEFSNLTKEDSYIKPDGGILLLKSKENKDFKRIVLAVEMKKQGTNDLREKEGKQKQAQGNAIERLGKNLIGIRSTLQYEKITPFICFGWGVDFSPDSSILDRIITMNEFFPLNTTYVFKREGFSPVSMYFREKNWEVNELYEIMKEVAETSIRNYIF